VRPKRAARSLAAREYAALFRRRIDASWPGMSNDWLERPATELRSVSIFPCSPLSLGKRGRARGARRRFDVFIKGAGRDCRRPFVALDSFASEPGPGGAGELSRASNRLETRLTRNPASTTRAPRVRALSLDVETLDHRECSSEARSECCWFASPSQSSLIRHGG
jgi:hypothetical protein